MDMTKLMQAIRVVRRIFAGSTAQAMNEAAECDRHFDGGEWSDSAHAHIQEDWMDEQFRTVAAAYGLDVAVLMRAFDTASYLQQEYEYKSH
jgi:membrane-bound lytic murein transglycosylase B